MKKIVATVSASLLLTFSFVQPIFASSYNTTLTMSGGTYQYMSNNWRKFDGESVSMSMTLKTSGCKFSSNSDVRLRASLYRKNFLGSSYISYKTYAPGSNSKKWANVGSGKYCWSFEKKCGDERDRLYYAACKSSDIVMSD